MNVRPKPGESEEEILKQQEEFLKLKATNKIKPSVTVESEQKVGEAKNEEQNIEDNVQMQLSNTFEAIPNDMSIGEIVEKVANVHEVPKFQFSKETGFPKAKRRDCPASSSRGSIFAQQMKKLKKADLPGPEKMDVDDNNVRKDTIKVNLPSGSYVLSGRDKEEIHKQNVELLKTMSEKEIIEEREKLLTTLDPAIVAFLKSRRKELENSPQTSSTPISQLNEAGRDVKIEEIEASSELLKQPEADKWINFDRVETSKLAWMKGVEIPKNQEGVYEARFDFAGWLMPFSQPEINEENRILYHHGEEPGRPGYTLQELFQLARSNVTQQKVIALNTIANIFSLYSAGIYENILDLPVEQTFFVVRMCLDDNTPSVLNAAIKAMRSLVFCEVDETCLNSVLGFGVGVFQPILAVDEEEDDKTVNDQQLVETNLVKCLARTDILIRIRYIINTVRPTTETVVYCLEILQRLVRDSRFIMTRVYNLDGLIKNIIDFFVPEVATALDKNDSPYGLPLIHAVKLLRLLSTRSRFIATELINKYKIMDSIANYLSNETFSLNTTGLKLQTECLHLFAIFLQYNLALDYFSALQPIFLRLLDCHIQKTDQNNTTSYIIHTHVAALLILLSEAAKRNWNLMSPYVSLLTGLAVKKWFLQTCKLTEFFCGKLQIISGLLQCLTSILAYKTEIRGNELDDVVLGLIKSTGFAIITQNIKYGSNVLNDVSTFKFAANFKTIEAVAWETSEHTVPVLLTKSCIPFLAALSCYLINTDNLELKLNFLQHENIKNYLQLLRQSEKYCLTTNWFTKIESLLIMNILKLSIAVQKHVDTAIFYEVAVKCLNIFSIEQQEDIENVFKKIIFSTSFYPSEVLIKNLNLTESDGTLQTSLSNLEEVFEVYSQVLGLKQKSLLFVDSRAVDVKIGNIVPVDWIYSPILIMYSEQQENKSKLSEAEQIHLIKNCLRWIYIYEVYFPELAACINVTDRFCRLACVFLASDCLFLEADIERLLEKCLQLIVEKSGRNLNFDKPIQGLSNFQDFYAQLLEQYQGVSYGNVLFGNVVLIPLAQRHNVKWRKTLWSEYAGVVQILNVTSEQCVCPLDDFLSPPEEDLSVLKCYRRALVTGLVRKQSILYQIANHHVENFVAQKREEKNKNT